MGFFSNWKPIDYMTLGTSRAIGATDAKKAPGGIEENPAYSSLAKPSAPNSQVLGQAGREAISNRALSTGPSAWAQLARQKQMADEMKGLGDVDASSRGALAQAQGSLARGGGLTSGANVALEAQAMRDAMKKRQDLRAAGASDRTNIGLQDEQQKLGLLQNFVGQDVSAEQNAYNQQMAAWAAGQQGNAILSANQPGLFGKLTGGLKLF